MRRSPYRHPLAVLRLGLGLGQKEMARLLGCSVATVQAIELKRLALSGRLAQAASDQTSVSAEWLLGGDPSVPPVTAAGEPFTVEKYEARQASLLPPGGPQHALLHLDTIVGEWVRWKARVFGCLLLGLQRGRPGLVLFKLNQAINAVLKGLEDPSAGEAPAEAQLTGVLAEVRKAQEQALAFLAAEHRVPATAFDLQSGLYAKANRQAELYVAEATRQCARELARKERRPIKRGQATVPALGSSGRGKSRRQRVRK